MRNRISGQELFLHEEVTLLALGEDTGTIVCGAMYAYVAAGAILAELLLAGRIGIVSEGRKTYAALKNATPLGDLVLDECLAHIENSQWREELSSLVERFACMWQLKHRIAGGLADQGILRADSEKILLIFTRCIYPERNPEPERRILERIRRAILEDSNPVDPRTAALIGVAYPSLLKTMFDRKEMKALKPRIEAIIQGDAIGQATKDAISAAEAAVMVAGVV